jgi:uncharacterized membrane protein
MTASETFLTPEEEAEIVAAIQKAEMHTSGEIRVHIESHTDKDHLDRAIEVFEELEMHLTQNRNGVLIYVAVADHQFYIIGDVGIDKVVGSDFWTSTRNLMAAQFKKGLYKDGLIAGISEASVQLKKYFPYQSDDTNELPNTISNG